MANIDYSFENSIPIGPLKIAALDSCKDFAKKVDDYIVSFRQHDAEALAQRQSMLDFRGYTPNEVARMSGENNVGMPKIVPISSTAANVHATAQPQLTNAGIQVCLLYTSPSPRD